MESASLPEGLKGNRIPSLVGREFHTILWRPLTRMVGRAMLRGEIACLKPSAGTMTAVVSRDVTRSAILTLFGIAAVANSRLERRRGARAGNQASTVWTDDSAAPKGLAMLIRSDMMGIQGAALAVCPGAIPAASMPTPLLGRLLLICP